MLTIVLSTLSSQDVSLPDPKDTVVLGISLFDGAALEDESEYLTMNIPTLIREQIRQFPYHYLGSSESRAYRERLRESAVLKRREEMSTLYAERDRLFIDGTVNEEQERQFLDKIQDLELEIEAIRQLEDENIDLKEKKPIEIFSPEGNMGFLPVQLLTPETVCRQHGLDFYISGRVEQIREYFYIEISIYNNILKSSVLTADDAGSRDTLRDVIDRLVMKTYDVIVGGEWAFIDVSAQPVDADIYLDDEYIGTGSVANMYTPPGEHTLRAEAAGYEGLKREISVPSGQRSGWELELVERDENTLLISSEPTGADVYSGALWIGTTPFIFSLPETGTKRLMITERDYSPEYLNVRPGDGGSVDLQLSPFELQSSDYVARMRDRFYLSAGFFVLSFPIPFFLYSLTEDLASGFSLAASAGNIEEMEKKLRSSVNTYHIYVGSIILTASLLINTLFRLAEYIGAGEY